MQTETMAPSAKIIETHLEVWIRCNGEWSPMFDTVHAPSEARALASLKARQLGLPIVLVSGERDRNTVTESDVVVVAEVLRDRGQNGWPVVHERPRALPKLADLLGEFGEGVEVLAA